jgi:L-alanine-DL-glutamate epimerase-like enolase superfamily enzyme
MDAELAGFSSAKAAIDFACYDVMEKTLNTLVCRLIGGKVHERIPCNWVMTSGAYAKRWPKAWPVPRELPSAQSQDGPRRPQWADQL